MTGAGPCFLWGSYVCALTAPRCVCVCVWQWDFRPYLCTGQEGARLSVLSAEGWRLKDVYYCTCKDGKIADWLVHSSLFSRFRGVCLTFVMQTKQPLNQLINPHMSLNESLFAALTMAEISALHCVYSLLSPSCQGQHEDPEPWPYSIWPFSRLLRHVITLLLTFAAVKHVSSANHNKDNRSSALRSIAQQVVCTCVCVSVCHGY